MFWSKPKLLITGSDQEWIEGSFQWLLAEFGEDYFLQKPTILPNSSFFPDKFRGTESCVQNLVTRVCKYMDVNPEKIQVELFDNEQEIAEKQNLGEHQSSSAAGLYFHPKAAEQKMRVAVNRSQLKNPTALVATIAHELGHVILLGGNKISRDHEGHEYLTDLITVFLGLGIFTANSAFQFSQWQSHSHQGWSTARLGYMSEEMFGYSLAAYAWMRAEMQPEWSNLLAMNVGHYFKGGLKYLSNEGQTALVQLKR